MDGCIGKARQGRSFGQKNRFVVSYRLGIF